MTRKRQRRAFGSITEIIRGKKYVCRWIENTDNGRRRCSKTIYGTYKEAGLFLSKKQVEVGDENRVPTMQEAYTIWFVPWVERQLESKKLRNETAEQYRVIWKNHIGPRFGASCIDKIKPFDVQRWLLTLSPTTASRCLTQMRRIAAMAYKYVKMKYNPLAKSIEYELPTAKTWTKSDDTYDLNTARMVLEKLHGDTRLEAPYIFSAFGGARVTESAAVKANEIERVENNGVTMALFPIVRHTKSKGHETTEDNQLKNKQSVRFSIVPEPYCFRLFEIAEQRKEDGTEWMCDRGDGFPLNGPMLAYWWNQFIEKNDLPRIPFSNLRKSWRTYMDTDYKLPWNVAETLMGHTIKGVTGKHYYKLKKDQAAKVMSEAISTVKDI